MSAAALLEAARAGLHRLTPAEAHAAMGEPGTVLVDVRLAEQRERDGAVPGAVVGDLNHLEWRVDQTAETPDPAFAGARRVIVLCNGGYASSLAAARLQAMGVPEATDVIGGYEAWVADGLPHTDAPGRVGGA